jgi:predicted lipid-binding transport protein (Tim44 family)
MRNGMIAGVVAIIIALGVGAYVMYNKQAETAANAPATEQNQTTTGNPQSYGSNPAAPAEGRSSTEQAPAPGNAPDAVPTGETPADQGAPMDAPANNQQPPVTPDAPR